MSQFLEYLDNAVNPKATGGGPNGPTFKIE